MKKMVGVKPYNENFSYFLANDLKVNIGDIVVVQTIRGLQLGKVLTNINNFDDANVSDEAYEIIRLARNMDLDNHKKNENDAKEAFMIARQYAADLKLDMRFVNAYYSLDRAQLVFNFISDTRIDFRDLAKKLAQNYKTRIELRQIGIRDKSKEVGGIGPCGRFLCCNTFLTDFDSVSINMAKNQYIALNPTKINGVCGRLLCCLKYEDSQYTELKKGLPNIGESMVIDGNKGKVIGVDIFKRKVTVEFKNKTVKEVIME